jgi:hypothetical protein
MNKLLKIGCLWAAVAAVPVLGLTSSASAQYRLPYDGKANEANNRIGSGGANPGKEGQAVNGNDIVTGNVTGGVEFRGHTNIRNPREFRGAAPGGMIDDFIKGSSSVDPNAPGSSYRVETFYGGARTVQPPPGFTSSPLTTGTGAYIPPPDPATAVGTINRPTGDSRIGAINLSQQPIVLPQPGQMMIPGPVDPTAGQEYITATPLTGIRQMNANDIDSLGQRTDTQYNPVRSGTLTPTQIADMQKELNKEAGLDTTSSDQAQPLQPGQTPSISQQPINQATAIQQQPGGGPNADQGQPINTQITQSAPGATDQGVRNRLLVAPPSPTKTNSLYAELLKRHEDAAADAKMTDEEAARAFNAARQEAAKNGALPGSAAPTPQGPGAAPGGPAAAPAPGAGATVPPPAPGSSALSGTGPNVTDYAGKNAEILKKQQEEMARGMRKKTEPVKAQSFAAGVKAKGLHDILKNAEDLMKDGKFTAALDKYEDADRVAPNDPTIKLARANAELGASYYARAEAHLREVFTSNPELLNGQYDLTALLGEQRLATLIKDLKDIQKKEDREPRAVFLLAYIAYNTGHEQQASAYLDLADKRSGGKDPLYKLLRDNWSLPEKPAATPAAPTPELNK